MRIFVGSHGNHVTRKKSSGKRYPRLGFPFAYISTRVSPAVLQRCSRASCSENQSSAPINPPINQQSPQRLPFRINYSTAANRPSPFQKRRNNTYLHPISARAAIAEIRLLAAGRASAKMKSSRRKSRVKLARTCVQRMRKILGAL